jgi:lysophospholipase
LAALALIVWLGLMWLGLAPRDSRAPFAESRVPPDLAERFYPPENWAWGLVQIGDGPALRYGVAAPPDAVSRAQVLILPDYGESAETWFETVRDLNGAGLTVWVLEGVGQGGSSRLTRRRDLGHVVSFDADLAIARTMADQVIRPDPDVPWAILGEGHGALVAARLVETGARPAALILSAPACPAESSVGARLRALGLGVLRAPGAGGWRRDGPDDFAAGRTHDRWRGSVTHRWQLANPDLRLGGPSLDWLSAETNLAQAAEANIGQIGIPTLVLRPGGRAPCPSPPAARSVSIPGAWASLELEDDAHRRPWLAAILDAVAPIRPASPAPLRSRTVTHLFKPDRRL